MKTESKVITLPNSKESEMMVLGCMLTSINALNVAADGLNEKDFFYIEHQILFNVLQSAYKLDKPADVHLVCEELKRLEQLDKAGGPQYVVHLAQFAGTSAYIEEYIADIKEHSNKRKLVSLSLKFAEKANGKESSEDILTYLREESDAIERNTGVQDRFQIKFLNKLGKNFLKTPPEPKQMLLNYTDEKGFETGFLPKGIVAMLVGAGGSGKTHLLSQIAISISSGTKWLDTFTPTKHCGKGGKGNVFFGLGENDYDDIHRSLHKASKHLREHQPDLVREDQLDEASTRIAVFSFCGQQAAFITDKQPSVYFRRLKLRLIDIAPKDGWSLIILDPISRLMGADAEMDNAAATQFVALLEELSIDLPGNPTILVSHHISKAAIQADAQDQTAARGASGLTDGVRQQLNFFKTPDCEVFILKMTKSNFTKIIRSIELEKEEDGFIKSISINKQRKQKTPTGHGDY